jgi:transcriptional antiterminator RfaH
MATSDQTGSHGGEMLETLNSSDINTWYCLRCKPKQEHIAARSLSLELKLTTFCPRMRYRKSTSRGPVWFVDAIFPGYIFVKCDISASIHAIRHSSGVADIVHFGNRIPAIPDAVIDTVRKHLDGQEMVVFGNPVSAGEEATVVDGPFCGLNVVVSRILPAKERVMVLMDVLGRSVEAEMALSALTARHINPAAA